MNAARQLTLDIFFSAHKGEARLRRGECSDSVQANASIMSLAALGLCRAFQCSMQHATQIEITAHIVAMAL